LVVDSVLHSTHRNTNFGKTAFTLTYRNGEGIRVSVKSDRVREERSAETSGLFEKIVVRREGNEEEQRRLSSLWKDLSFQLLEIPDEEVFDIARVVVEVPFYARIFTCVKCSVCGESVMEPRVRKSSGETVCWPVRIRSTTSSPATVSQRCIGGECKDPP